MTTDNPQAVLVTAEIDIHQAIKAVVEFSYKYPRERLSLQQAKDLADAAERVTIRIVRGDEWRSRLAE